MSHKRALSLILVVENAFIQEKRESMWGKGHGVGIHVDAGMRQTRGLSEFLLRVWERTAFPLGKKAQKETRRGKWKDSAGEAQVSVPDALPTWLGKDAMLQSATCRQRDVAILSGKLGSWSHVLLPL